MAVPPPLAARIDYHPQLPALRDQLTQRMPMGTVMKVHAVYPEPFWRAAGLTGQAVTDTPPAQATFDNTPPSGSPGCSWPSSRPRPRASAWAPRATPCAATS